MWKKVKGGGQVPHLSRWFDFCAGQPQLVLALEDAATASGIKRREIIAGSFDQKKIESECPSSSVVSDCVFCRFYKYSNM